MSGHTCVVCGNNPSQDDGVPFHDFLSDKTGRAKRLQILRFDESVRLIIMILNLQKLFTVRLINYCFFTPAVMNGYAMADYKVSFKYAPEYLLQ